MTSAGGTDPAERRRLACAESLYNLLMNACEFLKYKLEPADIDKRTVLEIATHYDKDIQRMHEHQKDDISPPARIGFLVFWVSKLKPISTGGDRSPDINEKAAVVCAHLVMKNLPFGKHKVDDVNSIPGDAKAKSLRLARAMDFYLQRNYQHLVYALRHRNLTGDSITLVFSAIQRMALFYSEERGKIG